MSEVKNILFVDDERSVLRALRRTFMNSGYQLYFADSGELGLKILAAGRIDLVLSDMRMPEMDGYEFLRRVRELYPRVIRLILSGFVEENYVYT
ncbi:MAG TPA: response regulator [Proteobacteria bacterium]|nr:response regulator [Pseudomonadota bacterium]